MRNWRGRNVQEVVQCGALIRARLHRRVAYCARSVGSEISVTETITETEIIHPTLTETETMVIFETELI